MASVESIYVTMNDTPLEAGDFSGLVNLTWMVLKVNAAEDLAPGVLSGLSALRVVRVYFFGNYIPCYPSAVRSCWPAASEKRQKSSMIFWRLLRSWPSGMLFLRQACSSCRYSFPRTSQSCAATALPSSRGSSGFRVGETDRGAPLGEAAVTAQGRAVQAHAMTCPARDGGGDGRATQKSEVARIGAAAQRMRDDVVDLDQMR